MEEIQERINRLDTEILARIERKKENVKIAMSIPGIAFTSASAILAEIGDYRDFANGEKLAAWCGLTLSQSANTLVTGSITKQGSKHVRRMLVQVAHEISRTTSPIQIPEQDMINVLANAGYIIKKKYVRGCI